MIDMAPYYLMSFIKNRRMYIRWWSKVLQVFVILQYFCVFLRFGLLAARPPDVHPARGVAAPHPHALHPVSHAHKHRIRNLVLVAGAPVSLNQFSQALLPALQGHQQLLPARQRPLPVRVLLIQPLPDLLHAIPEALLLLLLEGVARLAEEAGCDHDVDGVVDPAFDVAGVVGLAAEVVDEDAADVGVLEAAVAVEEARQLARDELEPLDLLPVHLPLLLQSAPRQSPQLPYSRRQVHRRRRNAPVLLHSYINIIRLAPMQDNFKEYASHLEGSMLHLAAAHGSFASFASDCSVLTVDLKTQQSDSRTLANPDDEVITALAMDPINLNSYAVGTASGCVRRLWPLHQYDLGKTGVMYKGDRPIKSLSFHPRGKHIGIATNDEQVIVYSIVDKRIYTLQKPHEGGATKAFFAGGYLCTQGLEGYLHLYEMVLPNTASDDSDSEDPQSEIPPEFAFMDRYKIAAETITKRFQYLNAAYGDFKGDQPEKVILASGQTSLQVVQLDGRTSNYRIERTIREKDEILLVQVLSEGGSELPPTVVTSSANFLSIWNYQLKERLFTLPVSEVLKGVITSMVQVSGPQGPSFFFALNHTKSTGKIYQFTNPALLSQPPPPSEAQIQMEVMKPKQVKPVEFVSRWEEEGRLDRMFPNYTQYVLEKSFEESQGARFLYYNNIGCIIERTDSGTSNIELELHDKSRPKRLSLDANNRPFWMFALRQDILAYATTNIMVFQSEPQLREGAEPWEFRWDNIQAISIGGNWVAVCSNDAVKILDYSGNELHTFCFDRKLVAFEAYEDMLAIAFHSAPPMWGCQSLKVRIYRITPESVTLERDTLMPIRANSQLKWFGFSEEGILYCQDNLEVVRGYLFERDEWMPVYCLDGATERLFIQHISGTDIYGFKLEQRGNREEPKVLPRSLPRRVPMELPSLALSFLTKEEDSHLRRLRLRNVQLQHEIFRYQRWYKLKYSRGKTHLWFSVSRTISSAQEIQTHRTQLDMLLLDYLRKFLKRWDDRRTPEFQRAAQALMLILNREAHFDETKESAKMLLGVGSMQKSHILDDCVVGYPKATQSCKSKLGQISILEKMLSMMEKA